MHKRVVDRTGKRYGKLVVIAYAGSLLGHAAWKCRCDCGGKILMPSNKLRDAYPHEQSCGCKNGKHTNNKDAFLNAIIKGYKRHTKRLSIKWLITRDQAEVYFNSDCFYCGSPPSNQYKNFFYNGIDRLNSCSHYEKSNCVACCKECNFLKGNLDFKDFIERVSKIYLNVGFL